MKWKLLSLFLSACLVVLLVAFVSVKKTEPRFEAAKEIIVLRNIAHEVLQYSGDSNSRVLPVTRISANEFLLNFESPFSFKPDSLVRIIGDLIEANHLPRNYIVNVLESGTENVVYGFAMFRHKQNNIVPCLGRDQPLKKYSININFQDEGVSSFPYGYGLAVGTLSLVLGLIAFQKYKKRKFSVVIEDLVSAPGQANTLTLGSFIYNPEEHYLLHGDEKIPLTAKEVRLLSIFAQSPNEVIDRNRLQKEVWEDEGVIVGRSLDVFISRLRKKLEVDPSVNLVNIHGKGYKLEIGNGA